MCNSFEMYNSCNMCNSCDICDNYRFCPPILETFLLYLLFFNHAYEHPWKCPIIPRIMPRKIITYNSQNDASIHA